MKVTMRAGKLQGVFLQTLSLSPSFQGILCRDSLGQFSPSSSKEADAEVSPCLLRMTIVYSPASSTNVIEITSLHSPVCLLQLTLYLHGKEEMKISVINNPPQSKRAKFTCEWLYDTEFIDRRPVYKFYQEVRINLLKTEKTHGMHNGGSTTSSFSVKDDSGRHSSVH